MRQISVGLIGNETAGLKDLYADRVILPEAPPKLKFWFGLLSGDRGLESGRDLQKTSQDALGRLLEAFKSRVGMKVDPSQY